MDRIYLQFAVHSGKFSLSVSLSHARTLFLVLYSGSIIRFFLPESGIICKTNVRAVYRITVVSRRLLDYFSSV